ncbi:hypothetical protein OEA41_007967 [Lepraria neglecta]|uniref:BTB domain-containing protein n=1 Tax=Lepraria neglecta TaxID=209136 RepID=A0AAD9ZGJ2_9LECA|nr:hypothetical protein OEA41_007967 [Lepraria neglecta]
MKYVECGIAARVTTDEEATEPSLNCLKSRFFNCVPLKFESTLPVQVHATFLLSGDRQNIATEETSQDAGSEWNNWLLKKKIPQVYLQFLEDVGRKIGHDVYGFFPIEPNRRQQSLSDLVRAAFWEEVKSSHHRLFPVVKPVQIEDIRKYSAMRPSRRQAPKLVEPGHAVFDLMDNQRSHAFRPLLSNCSENLVCPPSRLAKHVRNVPQFNFVTPSLIRRVLQSDKAVQYVESMMRTKSDTFSILLSYIIPGTDSDFVELDGCTILPLMDGSLGTLSLRPGNAKAKNNHAIFSAGAECRSLFSFASSHFSQDKGNENFVEKILGSGLLNLERFEKRHVDGMLRCKESWAVDSTSKKWLSDFWDYMNSTSELAEYPIKPEPLDLESLQHFPLLLCHRDGTETLKSLHYFRNNPAVLSSDIETHEDLYADFSELDIVDSRTIPASYREAEKSLLDLNSMNRFLRSVEIVAKRGTQSVTEFVRSRLKERNVETLRAIVMSFSPGVDPSLSKVTNDLPLWRRISSEYGYLTAKEALVAQDSAFVVPWMNDYHRFTDDKSLRMKTVDNVRLLEDYVLPNLPKLVDENRKGSYLRLVNTIAYEPSMKRKKSKKNKARYLIPLMEYRLAARQDGELCLASTLYDHSDAVFAAAFRSEASSKFLMPEARFDLSFWHELGLRRRECGKFKGPHYLACLHALQRRLTSTADPHLAADIPVVLYPLCANDGSLNDLGPTTWSAIAKSAVFPVTLASGNEPEYRRGRIEALTSQKNTLSLENIVRRKFAAVCWSQTPFALHEPSIASIQKSELKSQPNCAMVWEHLMFLAECAQSVEEAEIESFVSDLQRTYEFLHLNQQESKDTFSHPDAAIWLNVEATNSNLIPHHVLQSSWTSLENLILDSPCDASPLMMVHPFLGRFSSLLKEVGCKSMYYPSIALPSLNRSETAFAAVRQLRENGILTDVRLEAEGNVISAHKVILASRSLYCKKQFHGPWAFISDSNVKSKVIKLDDMTYATLKTLVEYCYNEHFDWAAGMRVKEEEDLSVTADKLDALLEVLVAADRWLMPDLHLDAHRQVIAGIRFFVRPENVKQVEKVADEANAEELRKYCQEYSIRNAEAVLLANAETG